MPDSTGPCFSLARSLCPPHVGPRTGATPHPSTAGPLPSFLSSSPPRSEGEALLRRIFSRGVRM
jgi:hypothetical protein